MMTKVKIVGNGLPKQTQIYINDIQVNPVSLSIHMGYGHAPEITMTFIGEVSFPDDLSAEISLATVPLMKRQKIDE